MLVTLWHHSDSESGCYKVILILLSLFTFLQHVRKYGSAFLNSDGGVLMAGILDDGKLCCDNKQSSVCKLTLLHRVGVVSSAAILWDVTQCSQKWLQRRLGLENRKCQLKKNYLSATQKQTLWSLFHEIYFGAPHVDFFCLTIVLIHKMIITTTTADVRNSKQFLTWEMNWDQQRRGSGSNISKSVYSAFLCRHCPWDLLLPSYEKENHRHCTSWIFWVSSQGWSIILQVKKQTRT